MVGANGGGGGGILMMAFSNTFSIQITESALAIFFKKNKEREKPKGIIRPQIVSNRKTAKSNLHLFFHIA